jgi:hypothetical protein
MFSGAGWPSADRVRQIRQPWQQSIQDIGIVRIHVAIVQTDTEDIRMDSARFPYRQG